MGYPVNPPTQPVSGLSFRRFANPSTTVQTILAPSGLLSVVLQYRLLPGATAVAGQRMRFVLNAASDADAAGKLATADAYGVLYQGDDVAFGSLSSDPILRIDFRTEAAVGAEVTEFQAVMGVLS